ASRCPAPLDPPYKVGMTFRDKLDAALALLADRGVKPALAAPPWYRLLWAVRLPVPPPHFQSLAGAAVVQAGWLWPVAAVTGLTTMVVLTGDPGSPLVYIGLGFVALLNGLMTGLSYRLRARRLGLTRWADFDPYAPDEADGW
ncbi:MAG: hypothetical protein K2X87_04205, partial [Gemmataceae bacterium]|nr:hypothetical protein [Gemmataceae bacterium]